MATPAAVNPPEMASDIPGSVALPVAPMASGQVRMAGSMPSRGGKRRSGMDFDDEDGEGPSKFSRYDGDQISGDKEKFARWEDDQSTADAERMATYKEGKSKMISSQFCFL